MATTNPAARDGGEPATAQGVLGGTDLTGAYMGMGGYGYGFRPASAGGAESSR
jgi:hypothetical protein